MSLFARLFSNRAAIRAAGVVFLAALLVRLSHLALIQPFFKYEIFLTDGVYFNALARAIVSGNYDHKVPIVGLSPAYTWFLCSFYRLVGYQPLFPVLGQILLAALSCVGLQQIGRGLFGERAGWIAGLLGAFCGVWIYFDALLIKASLANSVLIFLLWAAYRGTRGSSVLWWVFAGIACAFLCMLRMQFVIVLPWIIWKIFRHESGTVFQRRALTLGLFVFVAACTPFFLAGWFHGAVERVRDVPEAREIASPQAGIHFYFGNHESANGTYKRAEGIRASAVGHMVDARKIAEEEARRKLTPGETDHFWWRRALHIISENPGRWLALEVKKLFLILNAYEIPNGYNFDYWRQRSLILSLPLVSYGWLLPLAFVGWGKLQGDSRMMISLLKGMVIFYAAGLMLTFVTSEYRLPLYPAVILFAAHAIDCMYQNWKQHKYKTLLKLFCLFGVFFLVCNYPTYLNVDRYHALTQARYDKLLSRTFIEE